MKMNYEDEINAKGYVFLPNLISPEECVFYKNLLDEYYNKYSSMYAKNSLSSEHGLDNKSLEKVVYNLHNKNIEWYKLFEHQRVLEILDFMLLEGSYKRSEPYYLNNNSARCPLKGNPGQQLHLDSRLPGVNHCIVSNVIWLLDDFTKDSGATRIIPGSHKYRDFPEDGKIYDEEVLITGEKGGALIFNANIWHGGGPNLNGDSRWALALGYARWFIKPSFDYMQNTPSSIYEKLSLSQKKLMGFNLNAPKDEFTRVRRRSLEPDVPHTYELP